MAIAPQCGHFHSKGRFPLFWRVNMGKKKAKPKQKEQRLTPEELEEFMRLQSELQSLEREQGISRPEGKISKAVSRFFDYRENREKRLLSKKAYIWLAVLTGWMGGHRFYAHQWVTAILYLALFWCGFPVAMTIVDLIIVIPMKPDEEGRILL